MLISKLFCWQEMNEWDSLVVGKLTTTKSKKLLSKLISYYFYRPLLGDQIKASKLVLPKKISRTNLVTIASTSFKWKRKKVNLNEVYKRIKCVHNFIYTLRTSIWKPRSIFEYFNQMSRMRLMLAWNFFIAKMTLLLQEKPYHMLNATIAHKTPIQAPAVISAGKCLFKRTRLAATKNA